MIERGREKKKREKKKGFWEIFNQLAFNCKWD